MSFFLYRSVVIRFHSLVAGTKLVRIRDMAPRNLQARARHFIPYAPNRIARADLPVPSMPWFRNAVAALWIPSGRNQAKVYIEYNGRAQTDDPKAKVACVQ